MKMEWIAEWIAHTVTGNYPSCMTLWWDGEGSELWYSHHHWSQWWDVPWDVSLGEISI